MLGLSVPLIERLGLSERQAFHKEALPGLSKTEGRLIHRKVIAYFQNRSDLFRVDRWCYI